MRLLLDGMWYLTGREEDLSVFERCCTRFETNLRESGRILGWYGQMTATLLEGYGLGN
jgi:hypothetical protein